MRVYKVAVNGIIGRGFRPAPIKARINALAQLKARRDVLIRTVSPYVAISGRVPDWARGELRRVNKAIAGELARGKGGII